VLRRLDALLGRAVAHATEVYGPDAADDPYRGLVIGPGEVARLLGRPPGRPLFAPEPATVAGLTHPPNDALEWLERTFGLSSFDVAVLVVALAPEIDQRYGRLFGYLHDDVSRRRPSVDLVLNLLCGSTIERLEARSRFAPDAPLLQHRMLQLVMDREEPYPSLLSFGLRVDSQVIRLVLGESSLDPRLAQCAQIEPVEGLIQGLAAVEIDAATREALPRGDGLGAGVAPRLYLHGPLDTRQHLTAVRLAADAGVCLLVIDLQRALHGANAVGELIRVAFREAWFRGTALLLSGVDAVRTDPSAVDALTREVADSRVLTMLSGHNPWPPPGHEPDRVTGLVVVPFPFPDAKARAQSWRTALAAADIVVDEDDVDALADRYRLTSVRIAEAVASAQHQAIWNSRNVRVSDLFAAARAQSGQDLATLARKVKPTFGLDDLILPPDSRRQLEELRDRVSERQRVLEQWGFGRSLPLGRGISALFAGPSGTGKTMAADAVAGELDLDLYKIDLATVISKYIGDTEKNLERIFAAAENANAILFFDEADAIFGKRSEVRDAHDRYANIEIAYLLQRMEQYDGIAILATNLRENLDDAFLRRLQFIIEFPTPDQSQRERMWREFLPPEAPLDERIDFSFLARQFRLTGGNIKSIVLSAAYLASANGGRIEMSHLLRASWREHQKMGRILSRSDLGDYALALAGHDDSPLDARA
jgi:hypothetical protein